MQRDWQAEWQQLLDLTSRMLQRARAGEWDELSLMAGERQHALEHFFAEPVEAEYAATVKDGIATISRIDDEITALTKSAQGTIAQEQDVLHKRQHASRAYTDPQVHRS